MESRGVISLFSGAGGLDMAAERCAEPPAWANASETTWPEPLRVAVALDYEEEAIATLRSNFEVPTICGDIRTVTTRSILKAGGLSKGEAVLVIGGPPCTPFSKSGFWLDYKRESRDPDASLLDEFALNCFVRPAGWSCASGNTNPQLWSLM